MSAAAVIPEAGATQIVTDLADYFNSFDNLSLRLFKNNVTPNFATVAGDLTTADFDGFSDIFVDDWELGITVSPAVQLRGASTRQWTVTGVTHLPQTIYGYYLVNGSSIAVAVESIASPIVLSAIGQIIQIRPIILVGNCP